MLQPVPPVQVKITGARGEGILSIVRRLGLGGAAANATDVQAILAYTQYLIDAFPSTDPADILAASDLVMARIVYNGEPTEKFATNEDGDEAAGELRIVGASPTGQFAGKADYVAIRNTTTSPKWLFIPPSIGMTIFVQSEGLEYSYVSGGGWVENSSKTASYLPALSGARARNVHSKLGEWVSVGDFADNAAPGTTDMTTAVQAAIDCGAPTIIIPELCLSTDTIVMSNGQQRLVGVGPLSELRINRATPGIGLEITDSVGNHSIDNLLINGQANNSKLISVKAPQVIMSGCRLVNASGHIVYAENEDSGSGIYSFGLIIHKSQLYGNLSSGNYGVRLGLNSQTSRMMLSRVENCGTLIKVEDATVNVVIRDNVLERSVDYAIDLSKGVPTPLMAAISIEDNYFEENQVCVHLKGGEFHNLSICRNRAYRNTANKLNSFFYFGELGSSAASEDIYVEENYIEDFDVAFGLNDEYTARIRGLRGNTLNGVTSFSSGTFLNQLYDFRTANSYYGRRLTTGAFLSETNSRLEAKSAVFEQPIQWSPHEYLEKITFEYAQTGGTGVTVELHKVSSETAIPTDTVIGSVTANTDGIKAIGVNNYADGSANYYLKAIYDNTGTSGFIYPFRLFLRT